MEAFVQTCSVFLHIKFILFFTTALVTSLFYKIDFAFISVSIVSLFHWSCNSFCIQNCVKWIVCHCRGKTMLHWTKHIWKLRQYIPAKPNKYGLKVQALTDSETFYTFVKWKGARRILIGFQQIQTYFAKVFSTSSICVKHTDWRMLEL